MSEEVWPRMLSGKRREVNFRPGCSFWRRLRYLTLGCITIGKAAGNDALAKPLEVVIEPPGGGAVGVVDVETDVAEGGALAHHLERQYQQPWHTPRLFWADLGGEPPGEGVDVDGLVEHFPSRLFFGGKVRADFGRVVSVLAGVAERSALFGAGSIISSLPLQVRVCRRVL